MIDLVASFPQHSEDIEHFGDPFVFGLMPDDSTNSGGLKQELLLDSGAFAHVAAINNESCKSMEL